jgi:hypothetical protein
MKFEYRTMVCRTDPFESRSEKLNKLGIDGWELVSVDNGIAYFKRELKLKSEAEILAQLDMKQAYDD